MRRITFWLVAALFTFTIGVIASILWIQNHHSNEVTPVKTGKNDSRRVFINQDLKWKTEKDTAFESNNSFRYSENAVLLVFYPDGQFASINCLIHQADETSKMQLISNNGFGVRKGTWKLNGDDTIIITSRLTSSNKLKDGAVAEGQKLQVERLIIKKASADRLATELELNGTIFIPAPNIEGVDELLSMPNDNL